MTNELASKLIEVTPELVSQIVEKGWILWYMIWVIPVVLFILIIINIIYIVTHDTEKISEGAMVYLGASSIVYSVLIIYTTILQVLDYISLQFPYAYAIKHLF